MNIKASRAGMSLLEVMVSVFLVSIIAAGGLNYSVHSARAIEAQKHARIAHLAASQRIEMLLSTPYAQLIDDARSEGLYIGNDVYVVRAGLTDDDFEHSSNDSEEIITVPDDPDNQFPYKTSLRVQSRIRLIETKQIGDAVKNLCLEVEVRVYYGSGYRRSVYLKNYHSGA
jgi:prepilin-type N-terminal cleavage/methylation domain-containing protein